MTIDQVVAASSTPSAAFTATRQFVQDSLAARENPDDAIERWLGSGAAKRHVASPALSALMLAFLWQRLHRAGVWKPVGDIYIPDSVQLRKIRLVADRYKTIAGDDYAYQFALGALAILRRDFSVAARHFASAAKGSPDRSLGGQIWAGAVTYRNPWEITAALLAESEPERSPAPHATSYGEVRSEAISLLMSCDKLYFDRFARPLLASLETAGFTGNLFLATVDGDGFDHGEIESLGFAAVEHGYSLTMMDYPAAGALVSGFALMVRFAAARAALDLGARYVLVTDIDSIVTAEALAIAEADRIDSTATLSLTFNRFGRTAFPWTTIGGGGSAFRDNDTSRLFLRCVSNYAAELNSPVPHRYWLDQTALWAAHEIVRTARPGERFGNLLGFRNAVSAHILDTDIVEFKAAVHDR